MRTDELMKQQYLALYEASEKYVHPVVLPVERVRNLSLALLKGINDLNSQHKHLVQCLETIEELRKHEGNQVDTSEVVDDTLDNLLNAIDDHIGLITNWTVNGSVTAYGDDHYAQIDEDLHRVTVTLARARSAILESREEAGDA